MDALKLCFYFFKVLGQCFSSHDFIISYFEAFVQRKIDFRVNNAMAQFYDDFI